MTEPLLMLLPLLLPFSVLPGVAAKAGDVNPLIAGLEVVDMDEPELVPNGDSFGVLRAARRGVMFVEATGVASLSVAADEVAEGGSTKSSSMAASPCDRPGGLAECGCRP